jgi:hypothetical protein
MNYHLMIIIFRIFVMMKDLQNNKPDLSSQSFWDTDLHKLDFERYSSFAIIRVLERGTEHDIEEIIRYYGKDKIISTITAAKRLLPRAQLLGKQLFHLSNDQFECLRNIPPPQNYSMY